MCPSNIDDLELPLIYIYICMYIYIYINWLIGLVGRVFANDPGFNPRSCHTKDFKNVT